MNDQPGDQPDDRFDDRLGLDAFDDVDVPDQWDEIVSRADTVTTATSTTSPALHRRGPAVWFMAAAAAVLVVVAVVAVAARGGDEVTTPATTPDDTLATPVATVASPTTVPTSATVPVVPTTPVTTEPSSQPSSQPSTSAPTGSVPPSTVPVLNQVDLWNPVCIDRYGDDLSPAADATTLDEFTTVGGEPVLDITIPTVATANGTEPPLLDVAQVPGGVFVAAHASAVDDVGAPVDVTTLTVIDLDGTVRWRRCLAGAGTYADVLTSTDQPTIHVAMNDHDAANAELRAFDARNGFDLGSIPLDDLVVSATAGGRALATRPWTATAIGRGAEMALADVAEVRPQSIPYPELAIDRPPDAVRYDLVEVGDELVIAATDMTSATPDLVFRDGAWSDDPDDLRLLAPTLLVPFDAADPGLQLLDGAGEVVWTVPGFHSISREGFNSQVADSVVLAMECLSWTEENFCGWVGGQPPEERLVAYDVETGDELWSRPGGRAFAAIDGDRAIMIDDLDGDGELDGWRLIDLRTAETPAGEEITEWPSTDIFLNECCGAGDYVWTRLDGGVLFESTGEQLRVWLPSEVTTATVSVDLSS